MVFCTICVKCHLHVERYSGPLRMTLVYTHYTWPVPNKVYVYGKYQSHGFMLFNLKHTKPWAELPSHREEDCEADYWICFLLTYRREAWRNAILGTAPGRSPGGRATWPCLGSKAVIEKRAKWQRTGRVTPTRKAQRNLINILQFSHSKNCSPRTVFFFFLPDEIIMNDSANRIWITLSVW